MEPGHGTFVERFINRFPEPLRPHLHETSDRLLCVRTPKQALQAFEGEYEHLLRAAVVPCAIRQPVFRRRATAAAFVAGCAATAATVEEADVFLTLASGSTLAAPGTTVVVTVGLLATIAEAYAAGSVRVHQLHQHDFLPDGITLAADIRRAQMGDLGSSAGIRSLVGSAVGGGAARLRTRWAVGAIPLLGIAYSSYDATRTIRSVLQLPIDRRDDL
jgi:hypothetical protein